MEPKQASTLHPREEYHEDDIDFVRPCIKEMVQTRIYREDTILLVEKILITSFFRDGRRMETFRLWLSDGMKNIQAVLRAQAHSYLVSEGIQEGTWVRINDFELVRRYKAEGDGMIWLLVIADFSPLWNDSQSCPTYDHEFIDLDQPSKRSEATKHLNDQLPEFLGHHLGPDQETKGGGAIPRPQTNDEEIQDLNFSQHGDFSKTLYPSTPSRKRRGSSAHESLPLSQRDPNIPGSQDRPAKRFRRNMQKASIKDLKAQTEHLRVALMALESSPRKRSVRTATRSPSPSRRKSFQELEMSPKAQTMPNQRRTPDSPPPPIRPIVRPLQITPLASLTGKRASRNKIHDVFAVVTHVNPRLLTRKGFPDSREILIMDTSTTKQVHLTVFVDADSFYPEPGSVALFRNLTTHEWNGGSLKAYQQRCAGRDWYIKETAGWAWEKESAELKQHWAKSPEAKVLPERIWWTERGLQANR